MAKQITAGQTTLTIPETGAGYGRDYQEWKHWGAEDFGRLCTRERADFAALMRKAGREFRPGAPVLEIGFGNGTFLEFGRERGWQMHGTEVNPGLLESARRKGFVVTHTESLRPFPSDSFELVAAFDVLEHISLQDLPGFLHEVRRVLREKGVFMARFPNGDSPFGLHVQNGDPTHKTAIGSIRARYLAGQAAMDVVFLGGEVQAIFAGAAHTPHRMFAVSVKKLMNAFVNVVFSPRDPIPFCWRNLQMILRKSGRASGVIS